MDAPDEREAARIRALLGEIEAQRARGELAFAAVPLRLYGVGGGRFVRVLDKHEEAISPRSARRSRSFTNLEVIGAFLDSRESGGDTVAAAEDVTAPVAVGNGNEAASAEVLAVPDQEHESAGTDGQGQAVGEGNSEDEDVEMASGSADEGDGDTSSIEKEIDTPSPTRDAMQVATTTDPAIEAKLLADEQDDREVVAEREAAPRQVATPQELHEQNVHVGDWLQGGYHSGEHSQLTPMNREVDAVCTAPENLSTKVEDVVDHQKLWADWPPHLEERRRIWLEAQTHSAPNGHVRPVVYWVQNCFRVTQSNFALEAAIMLAQRLGAPLALVTLVRSSVIYPVRHAQTASDAYLRWSLLEVQDQCARANVAFHGITADETNGTPKASNGHAGSGGWERHQLITVLDAFHPHLVVTDMAFDVTGARDMIRIAQHLKLSRSVSSWSLVSIDSSSYVPVHNVSLRARGSLEGNASFLSEEEYGHEYAVALAQHGSDSSGAAVDSQLLKKLMSMSSAPANSPASSLAIALHTRGLELIDWVIVRGMAAESSAELPTFTERAGLKALNTLLAEFDNRPAIQAELQGGGVLSLLPFVRQGSLFSGYVIQRISEAIDFFPALVTAQDRKALATLKVMRSRALSHLAKERDYALYLALWTASQHEAIDGNLQGFQLTHPTASSLLIDSLSFSILISVPLDAYTRLLPLWVDNNVSLAHPASGTTNASTAPATGPSYDPYELESARTQDAYWNAIQRFFVRHQYLHPLLVVYWAYRVMQWAVSARAGIAMIDALVSQCAVGSAQSPDTVFMIWNALFLRINRSRTAGSSSSNVLTDPRAFQHALELELASQPKLQLP